MMDALLFPLANAAGACYVEPPAPTFENELKSCHVYESTVNGHPCFAFEGTTDIQEWIIDFLAIQVPVLQHPVLGWVHMGFWEDIGPCVDDIENRLHELGNPPFYITGHSKGAGEAILCHAALKVRGLTPLATRAYEPPSVGGPVLAQFLAGDDLMWTQTFNREGPDIVTLVPGGPTWSHDGQCQRLVVPDNYDVATKHRIPGVMTGLINLSLQ